MLYAASSRTNITVGVQYRGILEIILFSVPITLPCCVFLFINGTLVFTLRSKSVFRETSRYIFLYNLLFADTVLLVLSQLMYLLSACRVILTYPACGVLSMVCYLTNQISPLTLMVMCLERYVAVCHPLKHASIVTIRNTKMAIIVVWAFGSLNVFIQIVLLLDFPFSDLDSLQMESLCSLGAMFLGSMSDIYDKAYTGFVFLSAGVAVISSYIGVVIAARSASTNKASARKARNTLLLHLVQLCLSLSSAIQSPLVTAISKLVGRIEMVRINSFLYVCIVLLPRCLSALIYGIRDQTIRPKLMYHLGCRRKLCFR